MWKYMKHAVRCLFRASHPSSSHAERLHNIEPHLPRIMAEGCFIAPSQEFYDLAERKSQQRR